jgi:hypothetical protein
MPICCRSAFMGTLSPTITPSPRDLLAEVGFSPQPVCLHPRSYHNQRLVEPSGFSRKSTKPQVLVAVPPFQSCHAQK